MFKKGYKQTKEHKRKISEASKGKPKTSGSFKKGHLVSEETKRKMSKSLTGRDLSEDWKRKIRKAVKEVWAKRHDEIVIKRNQGGKKPTEETKIKMSEAQKRIGNRPPVYYGEKCHLWKGGISFEPYGLGFNKQLKEKVRDKFNRKCAECGFPEKQLGYKLHCHHIDYNKKNNSEDNLISLCRSCHLQTNFKREDWTNYFKNKCQTKTS